MSPTSKFRVNCIVCPMSCYVEVELDGEIRVTGYRCPRGKEWAVQEALSPKRVVVTVLKVKGGDLPVVSVKTDPVPRDKVREVIRELSKVELVPPLRVGQVVAEVDGVKVYVTREVRGGQQTF